MNSLNKPLTQPAAGGFVAGRPPMDSSGGAMPPFMPPNPNAPMPPNMAGPPRMPNNAPAPQMPPNFPPPGAQFPPSMYGQGPPPGAMNGAPPPNPAGPPPPAAFNSMPPPPSPSANATQSSMMHPPPMGGIAPPPMGGGPSMNIPRGQMMYPGAKYQAPAFRGSSTPLQTPSGDSNANANGPMSMGGNPSAPSGISPFMPPTNYPAPRGL